jgi:UDP-N-acetylmuramate dehydrogenase
LVRWSGEAYPNAPLARYTTFRLGGPADLLLVARSMEELQEGVHLAHHAGLPWLVLGRGSNVLVADAGFRGVVIVNRARGVHWQNGGDTALLVVASGESLAGLVRQTAGLGWAGLEWAAGIPGTVGGAVVGNAGAFGGCMADVVSWVSVYGEEGQVRRLEAGELGFACRQSRFRGKGNREVLLEMGLALHQGPAERLQEVVREHLRWRREHQPPGPSAGSVFRNPPDEPAGRLLDQAGMKGRERGGAYVSPLHANFILNRGGARAEDVRALIEEARQAVRRTAGVELELEIELLGEWESGGESG